MSAEEVPLALLVDGLELVDGGRFKLHYSDEASVRRALARMARALGWAIVQEEVVIPGWGRVDLVLQEVSERDTPHIIEIKLDLSRAAAVRKAFQQVDGYGRWWLGNKYQTPECYLTAITMNDDLVNDGRRAYRDVRAFNVPSLLHTLPRLGYRHEQRVILARLRADEIERELAFHRAAQAAAEAGHTFYVEHIAKEQAAWAALGVNF